MKFLFLPLYFDIPISLLLIFRGIDHHLNCGVGGQGSNLIPSLCLYMRLVLNPYGCVMHLSNLMVVQSHQVFRISQATF